MAEILLHPLQVYWKSAYMHATVGILSSTVTRYSEVDVGVAPRATAAQVASAREV